MILPTKHVPLDHALLSVGARIIAHLDQPRTVTAVWSNIRDESGVRSFDKFSLALAFLFSIDAVSLQNGVLRLSSR